MLTVLEAVLAGATVKMVVIALSHEELRDGMVS
jgi:hypothetical protein